MKAIIRGLDAVKKPVNAFPATNLAYQNAAGTNQWQVDKFAREGVRTTDLLATLHTCWSEAFPQAPLKVYHRDDSDPYGIGEPYPEHPVNVLIHRPTPELSFPDLMKVGINYELLSGTTYLHKRRDRGGNVVQLFPYSDAIVTGVSLENEQNFVSYFQYNNRRGVNFQIPPSDIIALPWIQIDPLAVWKGLSPILAGARQFDTDIELTKLILAMLYNGAFPGMAMGFDAGKDATGAALDVDMDTVKAYIEDNFGGENRGHPIILNGKLTSVQLQQGIKDLAIEMFRDIPETRACALYRIPSLVAGFASGIRQSSYNNMSEMRAQWHESTIIPHWEMWAAKLTHALETEYPEPFVLKFDYTGIKALQTRQADEQERYTNGYIAGLLAIDEGRQPFNVPNVPAKDAKFKEVAPVVVNTPNENIGNGNAAKTKEKNLSVNTNGKLTPAIAE